MDLESFFHVAIKTDDLEESLAFYRDELGATVLERGDATDGEGATAVNHVALSLADKRVYLFDWAPYEAAGLVDSVPTGFLHFGYVVPDVDDAMATLPTEVDVIMEPTTFGDLRIAFFSDPSGVRIELLEHID